MNENEQSKQNTERSWANILLRHLNANDCDYKVGNCKIPAMSADVDVCAYSESGSLEPLYLQLCLDVKPGDEGYERIPGTSKSHTFNRFGDTIEAIKAKAQKYTKQSKKFSHITVVVQSYYLIEDDREYRIPKLTKECSQLGFKAVYILSPKGEIYGGEESPSVMPERVFKIC